MYEMMREYFEHISFNTNEFDSSISYKPSPP